MSTSLIHCQLLSPRLSWKNYPLHTGSDFLQVAPQSTNSICEQHSSSLLQQPFILKVTEDWFSANMCLCNLWKGICLLYSLNWSFLRAPVYFFLTLHLLLLHFPHLSTSCLIFRIICSLFFDQGTLFKIPSSSLHLLFHHLFSSQPHTILPTRSPGCWHRWALC